MGQADCIHERLKSFPERETKQIPQIAGLIKHSYLPSYGLATLVIYLWREHSLRNLDSLVIKTLGFLRDLGGQKKAANIFLTDFYNPTCWAPFKRRQGRKIYIRDPLNPVNDLAYGTD